MAYDYNQLYGENRDALGAPTPILVEFFDRLERYQARILDAGCGQCRDELFTGQHGRSVVGVDISANGIRNLRVAAEKENLPIQAVVADIATYTPAGEFDTILIDRTLHTLPQAIRLVVLAMLLNHVSDNGWLLIADEPSNIADFETVISAHELEWDTDFRERGYLFVRRS